MIIFGNAENRTGVRSKSASSSAVRPPQFLTFLLTLSRQMGAALPMLEASLNETLNETFDGDGDMTSQIGTTLYVAPEVNAGKSTATYNQKVKNLLF